MKRTRREPLSSKDSVKSPTGMTRELREGLKLKPGDCLSLDKATDARGDPFAVFSEWESEADERAYRGL
jgi:hypothetical protein